MTTNHAARGNGLYCSRACMNIGQVHARPEAETLRDLYEMKQWTAAHVGAHFGVNKRLALDWLRAAAIPIRDGGWNNGARYVCEDGHRVRSTYELQADNWLTEQKIDHAYEPQLPFDKRLRADFLANGWYIEIWGVGNSPVYTARKKRKQELYRLHAVPLLELPLSSFNGHTKSPWEKRIKQVFMTPPCKLLAP